jgi:hypothetical protein
MAAGTGRRKEGGRIPERAAGLHAGRGRRVCPEKARGASARVSKPGRGAASLLNGAFDYSCAGPTGV